jgi:EAL domain-containing protein (putative c-di-GMP-specific phosphodiesterase class I)
VRWDHPTRGEILPGRFIPIAEETGSIVELGRWVLREACRQLQALPDTGTPLELSVNVSPRQLLDPRFVDDVAEALASAHLEPARLTLEITEGVVAHDIDAAVAVLLRLRAIGVKLAIDDFGTGYSSLTYLRRLPVDVHKIDRSFVAALAGDPTQLTFVESILQLAETLGLHTVAEGVEEQGQLTMLRRLNMPLAQGFLFARPLSAEQLIDHLGSSAAGATAAGQARAASARRGSTA